MINEVPIHSYIGQKTSDDLTIVGIYGRAKKKFQSVPIFYAQCAHCKCRNVVTWDAFKNKTAKCQSSLCAERLLRATDRRDSARDAFKSDRQAEREAPIKAAEAARESAEEKRLKDQQAQATASELESRRRAWVYCHDTFVRAGKVPGYTWQEFQRWPKEYREEAVRACQRANAQYDAEQAAPAQVDAAWIDYEKQCAEKGIVADMGEFLQMAAEGI